MDFKWMATKPGHLLLSRLREQEHESESDFERADLTAQMVSASLFLSDDLARQMLLELSQAGMARERDILTKWSKRHPDARELLQKAKEIGVLTCDALIECRQTGALLSRVEHKVLDECKSLGMRCPSCGRAFKDELVTEAYAVAQLGRTLLQHSHWMTVWITNELVRLGVPQDSILWNLSESGEEVDIILEFLDNLWIFGLKDREFGAGDAYPFNYRKARYKAQKAIVVSTNKVSKDAKRVLSELARAPRISSYERTSGPASEPIYIEGLEHAQGILRNEMAKGALTYASERVEILALQTGFDLRSVLMGRFGFGA